MSGGSGGLGSHLLERPMPESVGVLHLRLVAEMPLISGEGMLESDLVEGLMIPLIGVLKSLLAGCSWI